MRRALIKTSGALAICLGLLSSCLRAQESPVVSRAERIAIIEWVLVERLRTFGPEMRVDRCGLEAFVGPGPEITAQLDSRLRAYVPDRIGSDCPAAAPGGQKGAGFWHVVPVSMRPDREQPNAERLQADDRAIVVRLQTHSPSVSRVEEYTIIRRAGRWSATVAIRLFGFEYH